MDIGLLIIDTLPQLIAKVVKVVDTGLKRTSTQPQVIEEVVDVGQVLPATLPLVAVEDMLIGADLGHKITSTILLAITKQELMFKGEVDICFRPDTIPPITKVNMVD